VSPLDSFRAPRADPAGYFPREKQLSAPTRAVPAPSAPAAGTTADAVPFVPRQRDAEVTPRPAVRIPDVPDGRRHRRTRSVALGATAAAAVALAGWYGAGLIPAPHGTPHPAAAATLPAPHPAPAATAALTSTAFSRLVGPRTEGTTVSGTRLVFPTSLPPAAGPVATSLNGALATPPAPAAPAAAPAHPAVLGGSGSSTGGAALTAALGERGVRYVWGGTSPSGFDCSGLMQWAYRHAGVTLPRSSSAQSSVGHPVSKADLRPGDLVFFYSPVSHVGMYVGNGMVVHAPEPGQSVKLSPMSHMPFHNARRL
jgi:peptidoglycan DL-endopeptidase CwlO